MKFNTTNLLAVEGTGGRITILVIIKSLFFQFKVILPKCNALDVAGFQVLYIDLKGFNERREIRSRTIRWTDA